MSSPKKLLPEGSSTSGASSSNSRNEEPIPGTSSDGSPKRKGDEKEEEATEHKNQRRSATPLDSENLEEAAFSGYGSPVPGLGMISDSSSSSSDSSSISMDSDSSNSTFSLLNQLRREKALSEPEYVPEVLQKPKPKHKWFITNEVVKRERGHSNRNQGNKMFEDRIYGSLRSVQRLELMYKLEMHCGCVNCLGFNQTGELLASGSDDLHVCVWNWATGKLISSLRTGHKGNIFQCKFLPLRGHIHIATCARDGEVRLMELDSTGSHRSARRLGSHTRASHKLSIPASSTHCFYTCGEDGSVLHFDIRQNKPNKILKVRENIKPMPLYTMACHPLDEYEFMVGGKDEYLRLYDRRRLTAPVIKLTPKRAPDLPELPPSTTVKPARIFVSSAVYNYNGSELLASYNDDDVYLWDRYSSSTEFVHKYQGHRNKATVKGVNYFGPRSEFVVSGSDCRYIYFWDKESEAIVQWLEGDENGVVNCLEPHPSVPILASSGLDDDVKIWVPSKEEDPEMENLKETVIMNLKERDEDTQTEQSGDVDAQMLWLLWRHLSGSQAPHANNLSRREAQQWEEDRSSPPSSPPQAAEDPSSTSEPGSPDSDIEEVNESPNDCSPS